MDVGVELSDLAGKVDERRAPERSPHCTNDVVSDCSELRRRDRDACRTNTDCDEPSERSARKKVRAGRCRKGAGCPSRLGAIVDERASEKEKQEREERASSSGKSQQGEETRSDRSSTAASAPLGLARPQLLELLSRPRRADERRSQTVRAGESARREPSASRTAVVRANRRSKARASYSGRVRTTERRRFNSCSAREGSARKGDLREGVSARGRTTNKGEEDG